MSFVIIPTRFHLMTSFYLLYANAENVTKYSPKPNMNGKFFCFSFFFMHNLLLIQNAVEYSSFN